MNSTQCVLNDIGTMYIRNYAYEKGKDIYKFMDKYDIGKSNYGKIMDLAGKDKSVMAHRLYGHNLIYDFPFDNLQNAYEFYEHIFSDIFTKQGIPIIPGEILKNIGLLKACDKLKGSWNFVNGFDILAGTVAIYQGIEKFKQAFSNEFSVNDIEDMANTFGIGALELAIAMTSANPFLLIGATLHLVSGVIGILNDSAIIYFKRQQEHLTIEFAINSLNIKEYQRKYSIEHSLNELSIENSLSQSKLPYKY